jgi:protein-S-isoprenylcysteine O-methyltransferase Ste14
LKLLSLVGLAAMLGLWETRSLFSAHLGVVAIQLTAVFLMIWARVTFGFRSFHPAANPTASSLVTTGPYHFIRHPIYASICLFLWAGVLGNLSPIAISLGAVATIGALLRLFCEEHLLTRQYPKYREYAASTRRLLPGV